MGGWGGGEGAVLVSDHSRLALQKKTPVSTILFGGGGGEAQA